MVKEFPGTAYVFGNELGERVKTVRKGWRTAADVAGLGGRQLRDLRHEAACRLEEAGTPVSDVSKLLGHTSLSTTSRYLMNMQRRALGRAVERLERFRETVTRASGEDVGSKENEEGHGEFANNLQTPPSSQKPDPL